MRIQLDGRNVVAELKLEGERISRYAIADTLPDDTPLTETATEQSRGAVIPQVFLSPPPPGPMEVAATMPVLPTAFRHGHTRVKPPELPPGPVITGTIIMIIGATRRAVT